MQILKADLKHVRDKRGAYLDMIRSRRVLPLDPSKMLDLQTFLYVVQYVGNPLTNVRSQSFLVVRLVKLLSASSPDKRYHGEFLRHCDGELTLLLGIRHSTDRQTILTVQVRAASQDIIYCSPKLSYYIQGLSALNDA